MPEASWAFRSHSPTSRATRNFVAAKDANQNTDDYILATVFFATALFFAGISSRFEAVRVRTAILVMAGLGLAIGLARAITLPFG
ncbi:MAG: hypothetical protein C4521_07865 [Actinobacteria bacterium]|nr:MAG: hypothetical protein C4521_07865 [Actinomycetota bacterium]